jgi:multiple sugar transport system ATP-binding protein
LDLVHLVKVTVKNLTKKFGDVVAVDNLNIELEDKCLTVLLGPSGCGKTTTLRCIAGLETPDEGEIYIGDTLVNDLPAKDRDCAMVFQSYALYPHMSVFDNIAFPLKMRKISKEEIKERVTSTAKLLDIGELLDRRPSQLSGGQAQRTALGRAIVRDPKVYLMDEPLSNLDAKLRSTMRTELKRLQHELGVTTIYVTHDQVEAMTMATKIVIMNEGILQQYSTPDVIYSDPANKFVGGFIGSPPMNFVECTFDEANGTLDAGDFSIKLPSQSVNVLKENSGVTEVSLGVRPEDVVIHELKRDESVEAVVYVVEPLGLEVIANLTVGDTLLKARTGYGPQSNDKVFLEFNLDKAHIFNRKTGEAII